MTANNELEKMVEKNVCGLVERSILANKESHMYKQLNSY
jgi:hypothetical protein